VGKEAAIILFAIAALQFVCGTLLLSFLQARSGGEVPTEVMLLAILEIVGIAVVFVGLGFWALYQPLLPAAIGLGLYVVLSLVTIATMPQFSGAGLAIRLFIVICLIRVVHTAFNEWLARVSADVSHSGR
jgi:hypothetical protein